MIRGGPNKIILNISFVSISKQVMTKYYLGPVRTDIKIFPIFKEFKIRDMTRDLSRSWIREFTVKILEFCQ